MSTYENNLRLEEIGTGEQSGTWGATTNTNLELIASAFSYSSTGEAIANASTHTITIVDGTADEARSFYLKCTGGGQACTVTLAPNTLSKVWMIENTTSYTLTFSHGSGANVAVAAGEVKMIASDGAGSGGAVFDLFTDVNFAGTTALNALKLGGTAVTSTAAELNLIDGGTSRGTTAVASGDGILINDAGTMRMTNVDTVSTYFSSHSVGGGSIVATGALDSGSITSGFGTIDTGSSTITTTGLISGGSLDIDNVLINGTTIGHTDDTDLITVASGLVTVAGEVSMTTLDIGGTNVSSTAAELNILDGVTSTATEINILDGDTSAGTTAVAGADGLVTNDGTTMRQTTVDTFDTYLSATTKTLTNKTLTTPTLTTPIANAGVQLKNGSTSAGFLEFFEDSGNGTNKVTLIGPASTADITLTLPSSAGTIATTVSAADEATALAIALG